MEIEEAVYKTLSEDIRFSEFEDLIESFGQKFSSLITDISNDAWLSKTNIIETIKKISDLYLEEYNK